MSRFDRIMARRTEATVKRRIKGKRGWCSDFMDKQHKRGDGWWRSRIADLVEKRKETGQMNQEHIDIMNGRTPGPEARHCDDYIDDETAPAVLRKFLKRERSPGHGMTSSEPYPRLFADHDGKRVRVVMASRLGDVGITADIDADIGYQMRVDVAELANFGDAP